MDLVIGREDGPQRRLSIKKGGKVIENLGIPMSVPVTVSRDQIILNIDENTGVITLKNQKPNNVVFVNGHGVESKVLMRGDRVELGNDRWPLPLDEIADKYVPKFFDLTPLKRIWDDYEQSIRLTKISNNRRNAYRAGIPILSTLAIAIPMISGERGTISMILYAFVILFNIIFFIDSFRRSAKSVDEEEQRKKQFMASYVCPNPKCRHFMGNSPYEIISQNDKCPWCKSKFSRR